MKFLSTKNKYAREILKKSHMEICNATTTPTFPKEMISKEDITDRIDEGNFRSLIEYLMHLTATRMDVLFIVNILSRFIRCSF